jgi:hypothetical protein
MRNKYPGICYRCGKLVEVGKGHFEKTRRGTTKVGPWRVQHAECAILHRKEVNRAEYAKGKNHE